MPAHDGSRGSEIVRLIKRADLDFVGEENIDLSVDEVAKCRAMPGDTERVRKGERDFAPRGMSDRRGFAESFLRLRRVEEVTFEIGDLCSGNNVRVDIGGPESGAGAEIGVHRPLPVGSDEDQAP